MAQAAIYADIIPRQLSFKHTLQIWIAWSKQQFKSAVDDPTSMFLLIAEQRVGNRGTRIEPRAIKRRPKPYSFLTKPRNEARTEIKKFGHPKKLK